MTLNKMWRSFKEPRVTTVLAITAYLVAGIAGAGALVEETEIIGARLSALRVLAGAILVLSAALGIPTAWRGVWWLERGAAGLAALSSATAFAVATMAHYSHLLALPVFTLWGAAMSVIYFASRLSLTIKRPYALGKGPMLPEEIAKVQLKSIRDHT